jgi:hypothetical protein
MSKSVKISFGTWEERFNALTLDPDGLRVDLTYIDDVDGPDYEFVGHLQVKIHPFCIVQSFTYRLTELAEFYESLRALHAGQTHEARLTNIAESFCIILSPTDSNLFSVSVELDIPQASVAPLVISGFALEKLELISLMRRVRQSFQDG